MKKLINTLEAGKVLRYHATPSVPCQDLASHQWNVAIICHHLCTVAGYDEQFTREVVMLGLFHDTPELITGDIPAPVKWERPDMEAILRDMEQKASEELYTVNDVTYNSTQKQIMKIADSLEGFRWCKQNEMGLVVATRWEDHILKKWEAQRFGTSPFPQALIDEWESIMVAFGIDQERIELIYDEHETDGSQASPAYVNQG